MHARRSVVCALGLIVASLSQAQAQSVSDVFKRVNRSVVIVYTSERTLASGAPGQYVDIGGLGSGVLVSNKQTRRSISIFQDLFMPPHI